MAISKNEVAEPAQNTHGNFVHRVKRNSQVSASQGK